MESENNALINNVGFLGFSFLFDAADSQKTAKKNVSERKVEGGK
jgi:hypothetical protein